MNLYKKDHNKNIPNKKRINNKKSSVIGVIIENVV